MSLYEYNTHQFGIMASVLSRALAAGLFRVAGGIDKFMIVVDQAKRILVKSGAINGKHKS